MAKISNNVRMPDDLIAKDKVQKDNDKKVKDYFKHIACDIKEQIDDYALSEFSEPYRTRLGCSILGEECDAYLYFNFRWVKSQEKTGRQIRLFKRGDREEEWLKQLLIGIGCKVYEPEKAISDVDGHFGGRVDFIVELPEDIKEKYGIYDPLVGECKTSSTGQPFNKLSDGIETANKKHALQNDIYGLKLGFKYGLYISTNKNDDDMYIQIRHIDTENALKNLERARDIVYSQSVPEKISRDPTFFRCKHCDYKKQCHGSELPDKNCRSCVNARPVENGEWECTLFKGLIPKDFIPLGCDEWDSIATDN